MAGRKGFVTTAQKKRDYPFAVEIRVPPGGLANYWAMHDSADIFAVKEFVTHSRCVDFDHDYAVFRFKTREQAEQFKALYGGDYEREAKRSEAAAEIALPGRRPGWRCGS